MSDLFFDYLDLVERLRPRVAIAENVKGMILGNAKGYTKMVMQRFKEIGYRPQLFLVNAADCGVPQKRERVFFVALRDDIEAPPLVLKPKHRWVSAGESTEDVQVLTAGEVNGVKFTANTDKKWWYLTHPGERYEQATIRAGLRPKLFNHNKVSPLEPCPSLLANESMFTHWNTPRFLTYREWKRLGSFPDDYQAKTDKIGKYMIGMSVPPKMTEQVARAVIDQWLMPNNNP